MAGPNKKLIAAVERYFTELKRVHGTGGGTKERSFPPVLGELLREVGDTLQPKVFCVHELAAQGTDGHPDIGLYTAKQVQKGAPRPGQKPERGVVEIKSVREDARLTAASDQVRRYAGGHGLVLVTNLRDFVLVAPPPPRGVRPSN